MPFAFLPPPRLTVRKALVTQADYRHLQQIARQREPAMRKAIAKSFAALRGSINHEHLREAVHSKRVENVLRAFDFSKETQREIWKPAISVVNDSMLAGAQLAGRQLLIALKLHPRHAKRFTKADRVSYEIHFDLTNPFAQAWADANSAAMITAIDEQTRLAIQALTTRAFEEGIAPADLADLISEMVGQNRPQAIAWLNYRESLLASDLAIDRVDDLLSAYRDRQIDQRAETIARHELLSASNHGQRNLWRASADAGLIEDTQEREWITTPDDRLCDECAEMDGETTGIDEPWDTAEGACDIPQDIHTDCRCAQGLVNLPAMQDYADAALDDPSEELSDLLGLDTGDDDGGDD